MKLTDEMQAMAEAAGAKVRLRIPWWLRPFLFRDIAAITIGRRVYVAAHAAQEEAERLLRHELVHVRQAMALGLVRFWWLYVSEYIRNRRSGMTSAESYRRISFEAEAYAAEAQSQPDV